MLALPREVTVTFTMAGVTRAARVSMAWSSESSAPTLLSSSGGGGRRSHGCRLGRHRLHEIVGHERAHHRDRQNRARSDGGPACFSSFAIQLFISSSPVLTTNYLVGNCKKKLKSTLAMICSVVIFCPGPITVTCQTQRSQTTARRRHTAGFAQIRFASRETRSEAQPRRSPCCCAPASAAGPTLHCLRWDDLRLVRSARTIS